MLHKGKGWDGEGVAMLSDEVIELIEVNPAQAQQLAEGRSPLPAVGDYPHADSAAAARMARDSLAIDNWVPGFGMHLIKRHADGLIVGDVGFHTPPDERGVVEIGYGLAPSARGRGLAARAVRLLVAHALRGGRVASVLADTTVDNPDSIRVLDATGFALVRRQGNNVRYRLAGMPTPQPTGRDPVVPLVVIVVFAPLSSADDVRQALASAGAGRLGAYSACSFSAPGQGRFLPLADARPYRGEPGRLETVDEVRIECVCPRTRARAAIEAMLAAHPYEQPAYHCYEAITLAEL